MSGSLPVSKLVQFRGKLEAVGEDCRTAVVLPAHPGDPGQSHLALATGPAKQGKKQAMMCVMCPGQSHLALAAGPAKQGKK